MNANENLDILINDMPFINDEDVIGKWEYYDIIQSEEQLDISRVNPMIDNKGFKEIYFLPDGQKYWIFEGWTKGFLFIHYGGDEPVIYNPYKIKKINDDLYMFLEVNADSLNGEKPYINILKKTSAKRYAISEIGVHDNIDLPFIMDENVLGLWKSVDFVYSIGDFNVNSPKTSTLWLKSICFNNDGTAAREYSDETWHGSWTNGILIDKKKATASAYEIRLFDDKEYLFLEWKMGNYVYGGTQPEYYVFERSGK